MGKAQFVALNADDDARWYGLGTRGVGHALIIPAGFQNDPLASGGVIEKACGGKGLDAARLTEKFIGDARCKRCEAWLASTGGRDAVEAARGDKHAEGVSLADVMGDHFVISLDGVREVKAETGADTREDSAPADDAPAVRELTQDDVREAIRTSRKGAAVAKRAAAVERERERLADQRDKRGQESAPAEEAQLIPRMRITGTRKAETPRAELIKAETARRAERKAARDARESAPVKGAKYPTTRKGVTPGFDRRAAAPVDGRCGVHYRRSGSGWIAYANTLPGAVSGEGRTLDAATDAMLTRCRAEDSAPADAPAKPARKAPARKRGTRKAAPAAEVCASTGLTLAEMRDAVAAHYADGHPVPAEVTSLPDPTVTRAAMTRGTTSGDAGAVLVCEFRGEIGDERLNIERTHGKCPECSAYIPLAPSRGKGDDADAPAKLGKHNVGGVATPASKGLTSQSMDIVEHGSTPGDPASADKRRAAESQCKRSGKVLKDATGGTVACPDRLTRGGSVCGRMVELKPVTRKGKRAWIIPTHTRGGDHFRSAAGGGGGYVRSERKVTPRGKGADVGATVVEGARLALSRGHGSVDGSANVGGVDMPAIQPTRGFIATAGTTSLPAMVRPGVDPAVQGEFCEVCGDVKWRAHRGKSKSWRRRHSSAVREWHAAQETRREGARKREAVLLRSVVTAELSRAQREGREARVPVAAPSPATRKALRKAASIGRSAAGTLATTGTVIHATQLELTDCN